MSAHTNHVAKVKQRPQVGLAVCVTSPDYPNSVVVGVRKGGTGAGLFALPGGHLEFGESFEECARRETMEETGLKLQNVKFETAVNEVWHEGDKSYHFVTIFMKGEVDTQYMEEPKNLEPEKCEGWQWHNWDHLPDNTFHPLKKVITEGYSPFKN